jgi:dihydrofolate reductase
MGKIVITTNVTLDGVVEDPDGHEGFARGGWFSQFGGRDLEAWAKIETEEALRAKALLLGRRSDEWFATRWLSRTGPWADKLNSMPKYVVSSTIKEPRKREISGEILVYASYQLANTLIENDLVDEVRLVMFPVVIGSGKHLFTSKRQTPMRLINATTIGDGLTFVTYEVVKTPDTD